MVVNNYRNITEVLNYHTKKAIRWCTPSIIPSAAKITDFYSCDMSISYHKLGYPTDPSGIFLKAYKKAAKVYGADLTLFSVNGTTGSNFIVFRALSKQIPRATVLAQRNIHQSALAACEDYGLNIIFLPSNIDNKLNIFIPNMIEEIVEYVDQYKPDILFLTNPTYEGMVLDLANLIKKVRKINAKIIIFVDEAWGAHLHFSKKLPESAMNSGADICTQSTHKQGGALQQTSMIHLKKGRVNESLLLASYRHLMTTSPSFILLASLDAACESLNKNGNTLLQRSLDISAYLSKEIAKIPSLNVVDVLSLQKRNREIFGRDETKVIIDLKNSKIKGYELSHELESRYGIIIEMSNANMVLLLVPFQATLQDAQITVEALSSIVQNYNDKKRHNFNFPKIPADIHQKMSIQQVSLLNEDRLEFIDIDSAKGRVAAEYITPYPPGIPVTIKGGELTKETINFYLKFKKCKGMKANARDVNLDKILVVK